MELQAETSPRKLALHEFHAQKGANFRAFDGWLLPAFFSDPIAENLAVRKTVGIMDLSPLRYLKVKGPDRASFLQGITTNDVATIRPGEGLHSAILTVKGHVIADFVLLAFEDRLLLETEPSIAEKLRSTLLRYKIREKVTIESEDELGTIGVQGPKSPNLISKIIGGTLPELKTYHHALERFEAVSMTIRRQSITGEEGYILTMPQTTLQNVWENLLKEEDEFRPRPIGYEATESLRIEAGIARSGVDITEENIPLEIENDDMISFTKGCYVGQEVIARLKFLGQANKHLRGLLLNDATIPATNSRIIDNQREIGKVTSSTYSPTLKRPIAMAYLRREYAAPGTSVTVALNGTSVPAIVAGLPFLTRPSAQS